MNNLLLDDSYSNNHEINKKIESIDQKSYKKRNNDKLSKLDSSWASLRNLFKYQPLWGIRSYFGEYVALYFAFCGVLISSLWIPTLTGVAFFALGLIDRL